MKSELDAIGVKPMSSVRVSGEQARALKAAAAPLTVDELLVVIAWSNRRERWPVLAMNELDTTRFEELLAFLTEHPHGSKGRAQLIRTVADWAQANPEAAGKTNDDDAGDGGKQGKLV